MRNVIGLFNAAIQNAQHCRNYVFLLSNGTFKTQQNDNANDEIAIAFDTH